MLEVLENSADTHPLRMSSIPAKWNSREDSVWCYDGGKRIANEN